MVFYFYKHHTKKMNENKCIINIDEIMKKIRNDIKEKGYTNEMLGFEELNIISNQIICEKGKFYYEEFLSSLDKANQSYAVQYYRNIGRGGIKTFIKKCLRKALSFLIIPMAKEQMEFNASITKSVNQLEHYVREQKKKERDFEELVEKLDNLERELQSKSHSEVER